MVVLGVHDGLIESGHVERDPGLSACGENQSADPVTRPCVKAVLWWSGLTVN